MSDDWFRLETCAATPTLASQRAITMRYLSSARFAGWPLTCASNIPPRSKGGLGSLTTNRSPIVPTRCDEESTAMKERVMDLIGDEDDRERGGLAVEALIVCSMAVEHPLGRFQRLLDRAALVADQ